MGKKRIREKNRYKKNKNYIKKRPAITKHLNNIFKEGQLEENSVSSILEHTAEDGENCKTQFYNLDTRISKIQAEQKYFSEYEEFNKIPKIELDFDKEIKRSRKDA